MARSRILSSLAAAALSVSLFSACSAESLTERVLEQAIEGDQDIDLNFDDNGGTFTISTDEGEIAMNLDGDNGQGAIVFDTEDGEGAISFGEDGIVYKTDEGEGAITFDQDEGVINFDTDEGDGQLSLNENGGITVTTEDGEIGTVVQTETPDGWPQEIGRPQTLKPNGAQYMITQAENSSSVGAIFDHDVSEPFAAGVVDALVASGWDKQTDNFLEQANKTIVVSSAGGRTTVLISTRR